MTIKLICKVCKKERRIFTWLIDAKDLAYIQTENNTSEQVRKPEKFSLLSRKFSQPFIIKMNRMKCINHYIGGTCNNEADGDIIIDGCGLPLHYCKKCSKD